MKKLYTLLSLTFSFGAIFAQSIPFSSTGLLTANGWIETGTPTAPATSFPGPLTILTTPSDSGNSLSYAGLAASTGNRTRTTHNDTQDCNFALTPSIAGGTAFYSVLIKPLSTTNMFASTAAGDYFLHFSGTGGTSSGTFVGRIYIKQGATPATFSIGVLNNSSSGVASTPTYSTTEYAVNQTHLVVVKYEFATNSAKLFVDPTALGGTEPAVASSTNATGTSAAPTQVAAVNLRQAGGVTAVSSTGNIEIDEIRVGTTFASVTPTNLSVRQNDIAGLDIFPNPVTGNILNIKTTANDTKTINIFDVLGKQVLNLTTESATVNISNLNAGIYILKVTEDGKTATRKLMIK